MKKYIICPNAQRDEGFLLTKELSRLLSDMGLDTVICPLSEHGFDNDVPEGIHTESLDDVIGGAEMLITIGGDGTILMVERKASVYGVPVLGINTGFKGFMADLEPCDFGLIADAIKKGWSVNSRMMIDVELIRDGKVIFTDYALNDAVIRGLMRVIEVSAYGDGELISHFVGDGVIAATPTGSTGYSMSAGGPIVEPSAENLILTPICAHALAAKSFVLAPDRVLTIEIGERKANPVFLSVDGGDSVNLYPGDTVNIRESKKKALLVNIADRSFYKKVSEKLGERT